MDVFSFGVTLAELFAGIKPFANLTENAAIVILKGEHPKFGGGSPIPEHITCIVVKCWAKLKRDFHVDGFRENGPYSI